MNSLSRTEFRTLTDRQAQARLDACSQTVAPLKLHARHGSARCARHDLLTPKPEPLGWVDSAVFLTPMAIAAVLILIARWSGYLP